LHARFAATLGASAGFQVAAEVAAHWNAAGRPVEELAWTVDAGKAAEDIYAHAEAARHWERVTQLWDDVGEKPTGLRLATAYIHAIDAWNTCGNSAQSAALTEEAAALVRGTFSQYERAVLMARAAIYRVSDSLDAALDASREAVRLFAGLPSSPERARALARCGRLLDWVGHADEAVVLLNESLSVARDCGSVRWEVVGLVNLGSHELLTNDARRGRDLLAQAAALARDGSDGITIVYVAAVLTDALVRAGELAEAIRVGERALTEVRALGGGEHFDKAILSANISEALIGLGRVVDATHFIDPLTQDAPTRDDWPVHEARAELDALRGRGKEALDRLASSIEVALTRLDHELEFAQTAAEIAFCRQRPEDAVAAAASILPRLVSSDHSRDAGQLLTAGMRGYADMAEQARARGDEEALRSAIEGGEQLVDQHRALRHDPLAEHPAVATAGAERATWHAERARLSGHDRADLWEVAANEWYARERPHRRAYALWRQTEALLANGEAARAAPVLELAASLAKEMDPLHERIGALARRARIDLGPTRPQLAPSDDLPYGLTERELDVLRLLARGHTNAQIGAALFMSPKTASVHVTHILRKLGVSGRLQAATLAERAGIFDGPDHETD
jgi:DNA-binding CsgD family transcriptional regulator